MKTLLLAMLLLPIAAAQTPRERQQSRQLLNRGQAELSEGKTLASWDTLRQAWILIITNRLDGQVMRCWNLLTDCATKLRQPKRVRRLLQETMLETESAQVRKNAPWILLTLGLGVMQRDIKLEFWDAGLRAAARVGDQSAKARILSRWGDYCFHRGDHDCATRRLLETVEAAKVIDDAPMLGDAYIWLSRVYLRHDQFTKSLEYSTKARELFRLRHLPVQQAAVEMDFARAYYGLGKRKEARTQLDTAASILEPLPSSREVDGVFGGLGACYATLGDYKRATELLERSSSHGNLDQLAPYRALLARAYVELGRYDDAIRAADVAIKMSFRRKNPQTMLEALRARAFANEAKGNPEAAIADVRSALTPMEMLAARTVPADFMKRGFFEHQTDLIRLGVRLLSAAGRHRESLELAEFGRARAFLNLLASQSSQRPDMEDLEAIFEDEGLPLPSNQTVSALSADLMIDRVKQLRSTMFSYYVTPQAIYMWVVTPGGLIEGFRRSMKDAALRTMVERLRTRKHGVDVQTLRELHRLLIEPLLRPAGLKVGDRILVVPHGPLFDLPFAAVIDSSGRYLLESFALHYAYSIGLFDHLEKRPRLPAAPGYLLVAAPAKVIGPPGKALPALPASQLEVERIAQAVAPAPVRTLIGVQASADRVRAGAVSTRVVHFASHAVVDRARPFDSYLALSGGSKITAADIYEMKLAADLVVLSACRSASGTISADGVLGLTRAFFFAGARSVLASIWDVGDAAAARLLGDFYAEHRRSPDKAAALRAAQLRLLAALRAGDVTVSTPAGDVRLPEHPMLWAGFLLQGAP